MGNSVIRQDFMTSGSSNSKKGTAQDPMMRQIQTDSRELSWKEIDNIYKHNRIAQNIIDIPAEDATREGWEITIEDDNKQEDYKQEVMNKLENLDDKQSIKKFMEYERLTGDGFIALGLSQTGAFNLEESYEDSEVKSLDYLNPFSRKFVQGASINNNPFDENFGEFESFRIDKETHDPVEVHSKRILHLQTREVEGEMWGIPLFLPLYDPLTIVDSTAWSLGQLVYSATFKVIKSPNVDITNFDKWVEACEKYDFEFNTLTTALLGEDDEMEFKGGGDAVPDIQALVEFAWEYLSGSARMPKSHMLGQQQGTITGGQFDSLNYYMRIAGIQENYIRPVIERIVELIIKSEETDIPEDVDFSVKFNPLWRLDKKTDVEIRKKQAEIDKIYIEKGVQSPDDVSENRFNENPIADALELDENELEELKQWDSKIARRMQSER